MKVPKTQSYLCKKCETTQTITDREDGLKLKDITKVYCPICFAHGSKRLMRKIEYENFN